MSIVWVTLYSSVRAHHLPHHRSPLSFSVCQEFSEHLILPGLGVGQSQILSILPSWNLLESSLLSSPSYPHLPNARIFPVFRLSLPFAMFIL